ncbi:uncharacterized protein F5Z01DRAFT_677907 [Emericellopsis atlantica]|uniref:FAR1 domain-containing protein n=1 Tax=Emericellopsis atlantica TaxID=2614577 RepID=A0A9P7ZE94_9HYPO|nr:uncharacterized protein F5Z01DRAFT_677907 [Emericellopsis atlantica]KAG9250346.1 hypothetical protein F5Z01DRAFT_677907 [Emericellopsis atlantica]
MFGILEAVSVPLTGLYTTYDDLIRDLSDRAAKDGYKIVKARSHRARVNGTEQNSSEMIRCDLVCDRGGRPYKCQATKHKTTTKKTNCPWKAKAVNRKTMGGWVLTVVCDQHNHEPGTPEPPTPSAASDAGAALDNDGDEVGPRADVDTSEAMLAAGVPNSTMRLTGDTFSSFKAEYRKLSQPERIGVLSQLQLRVAALYAIQNEEVQRNKRQEQQRQRHQEIEATRMDRHDGKRQKRQQGTPVQRLQTVDSPHQPPTLQNTPTMQHTPTLQHTPVPNEQMAPTAPMHVQPQHMQQQMTPSQQQHVQHQNQQFHVQIPDSPSQQLMSMGMNLGLSPPPPPPPQQPSTPYSGPPKKMRGNRTPQAGQQPSPTVQH